MQVIITTSLNSETGYLKYNQSNGPRFGLSLTYPLFDGFNIITGDQECQGGAEYDGKLPEGY